MEGDLRDISELFDCYKHRDKEKYKYYNSKHINLNIDYSRAVSVVMKSIGVPNKLYSGVGVFISNLLALKEQFVLSYSRSNKTIPRQYNKRRLSHRKVIAAADWLVANNYAVEQRGRASSVEELRFSTTIWPTEALLSLFSNDVVKYSSDSYIMNNNPVVLKDKNKNEIDYRDNNFTRDAKEVLQLINAVNSKYDVRDGQGKQLNCSSLTRIFSEDWSYGGRLYRIDAQQIKQKDVEKHLTRLGITIDGMPVVEVDYCNLHAMLLCAIEGVHPDKFAGDMYASVLRRANVEIKPIDRSLIKKAFSAMLNSDTDVKAMQAIQSIINAQGKGVYTFSSGYVVWKLIYECFPEFQKYFDAPDRIGMRLQRADSDMCCIVCNSFANKELPIIPVHDSMVVMDEHGDILIQEMARAFKIVTDVQEHWPIFLRVESLYFPDELVVM